MRAFALVCSVSLAGTFGLGGLWPEARAAMPTPVNPQVTDVVTPTNVKGIGDAPAVREPSSRDETTELPHGDAEGVSH